MSAIQPRGGTEAQRVVWQAAGKSAIRELVVTTDEHRAHHEGVHLGPVHHGEVSSISELLLLHETAERGCWPGDTAVLITDNEYSLCLCASGNGEAAAAADWLRVPISISTGDVGGLETLLADYVTTAALTTTLGDYATTAVLSGKLDAAAVDVSTTLATNSDDRVPSTAAVRTFVAAAIAAGGTSESPTQVDPTGLVHYWPLDEPAGCPRKCLVDNATGQLADTSGWTERDEAWGAAPCANFSGSQYLSVSSSTTLQISAAGSWYMCFWLRRCRTTDYENPISKWSTGREYTVTLYGAGVLHFTVRNSSDTANYDVASAASITVGDWVFVVCGVNRTAGRLEIWIDGTLDATLAITGNLLTTSTALNIGRQTAASQYFRGGIRKLMMWSRLLTETEISRLYNDGDGLVWPLVAPD